MEPIRDGPSHGRAATVVSTGVEDRGQCRESGWLELPRREDLATSLTIRVQGKQLTPRDPSR